jgi:aspartyl-tRNA synthetase
LLSPYTPAIIRLNKDGGFAACAHFGHMAFTSSDTVKGDLDVTLPYDTIRSVLDAFEGDECTVSFSSSALRVKNAVLDVILALPDLRDAASIDQVMEIAEAAKESVGESVVMDYKEVKDFMARCKAIREKSKLEITFDATKEATRLRAETTLGDVEMELAGSVKKPAQFAIDAETFEELLAKSDKKEILLNSFDAEGFVVMNNGPTYMVISMNTASYEDD